MGRTLVEATFGQKNWGKKGKNVPGKSLEGFTEVFNCFFSGFSVFGRGIFFGRTPFRPLRLPSKNFGRGF